MQKRQRFHAIWKRLELQTPFKRAQRFFAKEGLPLPYIPSEMAADLHEISTGVFGTRKDIPGIYSINWFPTELSEGSVEDYLLFGLAGHGVNSWAMHYYLVRGGLALFIQTAYGGAYMDEKECINRMLGRFAQSEQLIQAVTEAERHGRLTPSQRLVVVCTDFYTSYWQWVSPSHKAKAHPCSRFEVMTSALEAIDLEKVYFNKE